MATSTTIQIYISLYMFLAQFLLKKNIFHERLGFNFFPAKRGLTLINGTACFPFKDYFQRFHSALNTRNSGKTARIPKVKLDFARRSFYFLGASIFNSLPLSLRNIHSRVLFRNALDDFYL